MNTVPLSFNGALMADTPETPHDAEPANASAAPVRTHKTRNKLLIGLLILILVPVVIAALWVWIALGYTYASGERAGYIQKISKKGWLCKTWEGELAMANLPGTMPQIFQFTVRSEAVAQQILSRPGQRVSLTYEQHRGLPTTCFGETEYFIVKVSPISEGFSISAPPS